MKRFIFLLVVCASLFTISNAHAMVFGINAGAGQYLVKPDPTVVQGVTITPEYKLSLPVAGVHFFFPGKSMTWMNFVEYLPLKIDTPEFTIGAITVPAASTTTDFVGLTSMVAFGSKFYFGAGLQFTQNLETGGGNNLNLAMGLGYNFSSSFFLDLRATTDFDDLFGTLFGVAQFGLNF